MPRDLPMGRNQSLYRAAPFHVIYNPSTGMQEMIRPWKGSSDHDTNASLVKQALMEELDRYAVAPVPKSKAMQISLELRTLEEIETVLYPTAFFCSKCHRLYAADPGKNDSSALAAARELERKFPGKFCCLCGGSLIQWRVLTVHDCGETIHVPTFFLTKCPNHGFDRLYFENHGSERIKDWVIVCNAPGCDHRAGFGVFSFFHKDCPLKDSIGLTIGDKNRALRFETAPIQKATNFLPKVLKILNSDRLPLTPRAGKDAMALALGALHASAYFVGYNPESGMEGWINKFDPKGVLPDPRQAQLMAVIQSLKDPRERELMMKAITIPDSTSQDKLIEDQGLAGLLGVPGYLEEAAAVSMYTFSRNSVKIADLVADTSTHFETAAKLRNAEKKLSKLKVSAFRRVEDIALTSCLIGYTRGDYEPSRVALHMYMSNRQGRSSFLAYTNTVRTEGVFLQLDPTATLKWVKEASKGQATVKDDFSSDLLELQKKFDRNVKLFRGPEDEWSHYQYVLLHSVSHLLIKALGKFSGLEQEGLTEKIYPYQNSVLIYSNQSSEFSLGGLAMAFEHHAEEIVDSMVQDAETCQYNPECEIQYGACPACIYVAEISCENYNRVLDRRKIAPSKAGAFWH